MPATAATDNTLWRRLTKALWSSSSSRTILFSSVVASKDDDDEFVGKCIVRFPPPFRERHRRDNVGGLEEENDKKTVVVVILGVFFSLSLLPSFTAQSFAECLVGTTTTFRSRGYCALITFWADNEKKKRLFFVKKSIQSRFHSSIQRSFWLKFILHTKKSAREALDTPPREAGIPSLARETHRLIIFARGFFGEEDKETEKQEVLSGNGTFQRVSNQKRLSVSDISSRGNICFLCAREDRERRDNRRSALRNTSRYQKRI